MSKINYVLTAIAVLTFIAWVSTAAVLGTFMAPLWVTFLVGCVIGVIGIYAYFKVSLMFVFIRKMSND